MFMEDVGATLSWIDYKILCIRGNRLDSLKTKNLQYDIYITAYLRLCVAEDAHISTAGA